MVIKRKTTPPFKREPLELPSDVAHRFVSDMRVYHAEPNKLKRDEIAGGTLRMLKEHYAGKLRVPDVKRMFEEMRDEERIDENGLDLRRHRRAARRRRPFAGVCHRRGRATMV